MTFPIEPALEKAFVLRTFLGKGFAPMSHAPSRWAEPSVLMPFFWSLAMGKKLYVGNLGYGVTDSDLSTMFGAHGTVESAQIIMDRDTGRSKGFGFVEMKTDQEAQAAIAALNGQDSGGRTITVNEARPKTEGGRGGGGGGGGGRGGYGGGGGGGGGRRY
jgi:cold-inducible RNA-binding protein